MGARRQNRRMKFRLHAHRARSASRDGGFTLIEVLVAIVVLSFGVLGVVGLQAASLQANKEARYQSSAVRLARELGDMMRGNKDLAILNNAGTNPFLTDFTGVLPPAGSDCFAAACTSQNAVAAFGMREWLSRVALELPGVHVRVCFDATPYGAGGLPQWACTGNGGVAVVKIGWSRSTTDRGSNASNPTGMDRATRPAVVLPLIAGATF